MKQLPKNIRQIGNVSDSTKVYIEDYVDTYVNQLRSRTEMEIQGLFFVGEFVKESSEEYYIVSGAILMSDLKLEGSNVICGKDTWKKACREAKESFEGKHIIGWALIKEGVDKKLSPQILKLDERFFARKQRLLMLIDANEKEEALYVYRFNGLMELQGHYIYYEKNPLMQDYMISTRKESALPPSETYEDRAAKDFRNIINQKTQKKDTINVRHKLQFSGVASVIALVAIGIVGLNQYENLQILGSNILDKFDKDQSQEETVQETTQVSAQENLLINQLEITKPDILEVENDYKSEGLSTDLLEGETNVELDSVADDEVSSEATSDPVISDLVQEGIGQAEYVMYTVELGDTLASISRVHYGDLGRINEICEINEIDRQDYIVVGQVIRLPK